MSDPDQITTKYKSPHNEEQNCRDVFYIVRYSSLIFQRSLGLDRWLPYVKSCSSLLCKRQQCLHTGGKGAEYQLFE